MVIAFFGNGDTISSSDTEPAFDYNSEYYYSSGDVYKVTFSSDGTGGYNITVSSLPEDTTSCGAGAGAGAGTSQSLDSSACDAFNNTSAYSITYTDDGDSLFGTGDTISSSDTEPAFDYNSEYYYSSGDVYKVTFSSDGTGGYNITVSSLPEDTTSCGAGAGTGTPPEFDETPSTSSVAQTKFTLNADINEEGIIYYVVVADGASAPSSEEVKAGTGNGGTGELASGNATVDSGDYIYEFSVSGLTGGTDYDVYLVAEDNEAIPNLQVIPEKLDVTTAELISLTISGISGGDKAYDSTTDATASGTPTLVGVESDDIVSLGGSPVYTFASANVGTGITITTTGYTISGTDSGNYTLTQPTLSGDITAKELTITGISGGDKAYDSTTDATASGTPTLVGVESDDVVSLGGSPVYTFASANVGTGITINTSGYTISGTDSGNYTLTQPTLSGDITAAPLIVTASDQTKVYGATDPSLTYTFTAFVNGEDESDLDTGVSISRAAGEDVDTYTITPSGAADSNYAISFVTADFTITAADLTVTASDQTKVYGATDPTLTYSITGFVNDEDESDLDTGVSISRAVGEDVDTYTITPSAAADSNYTVSFVTADFTITAADLTVTASDQTKVYGATDPVLTYSITGFVNGDLESDLDTAVSISRAVGEDVGTYTITPSAAADSNYTVSFVTADFTITAADLTVTAIDQTKVYGATDPTLTYSITGFQGTDTESRFRYWS